MKKKMHYIAAIILVLLMISFTYGFIAGAFRYPPYYSLKSYYKQFVVREYDKYELIDPLYLETNVSSLISIGNRNDVIQKRNGLVRYIWKTQGFPHTEMPGGIEEDIQDNRYSNLNNLESVDKITVSMDYGLKSIIYHFRPIKSNDKLIVYHEGHDGDFILGKKTIEFFLDKGYSVMAFSMPLLGMNNNPVADLKSFGKVNLTSHNYFYFLDSNNFSSIKFFVEPIAISLNYIEKNFDYSSISMIGISGGGWTTTLYSAIDPRISRSYSVAGSLPTYLRKFGEVGDYEESLPELYNIANYLELYILSSYGNNRKHLQVLNKFDSCCFAGISYKTYEKEVESAMSNLGNGSFKIYLDDTHKEHKISDNALNIIISDLEQGSWNDFKK